MASQGFEQTMNYSIQTHAALVSKWLNEEFFATQDFYQFSAYKSDRFFLYSEILKTSLYGYKADPITKIMVPDTAPVANF